MTERCSNMLGASRCTLPARHTIPHHHEFSALTNRGLLSYIEIIGLLNAGVVRGSDAGHVNGSSLDITLGTEVLREVCIQDTLGNFPVVNLAKREPLTMQRVALYAGDVFILHPGEFILAASTETFHLPLDISCEFKLKSSLARIGINQLTACWCDPGWSNSVITLELQNVTRYHSIILQPGDAIGQMVFFRHTPVPEGVSYKKRGRYNNDSKVEGIKA